MPLVDQLHVCRVEQVFIILQVAETIEVLNVEMADALNLVQHLCDLLLEHFLIVVVFHLHAEQVTLLCTQFENLGVQEVNWVLLGHS